MLTDVLLALESAAPVRAIRTSPVLYPAASAAHILSFALLVGSLAVHHLSFLRGQGSGVAAALALPAVFAAMLTGGILFACRATQYAGNPVMLAKLAVIAAAIGNAGLFHAVGSWNIAARRGTATASLVLWTATLILGRWIAFA